MVGEGTPISETWVIREGVPYPFRVVCTLKGFFILGRGDGKARNHGHWNWTRGRPVGLRPAGPQVGRDLVSPGRKNLAWRGAAKGPGGGPGGRKTPNPFFRGAFVRVGAPGSRRGGPTP